MRFHCSIDADEISDERSLHDVFANALGFPAFYGRNWDAWIDCMTYLDEPESGISKVTVPRGEIFTVHIKNAESFRTRCPDIFAALFQCAAFVNQRRSQTGDPPILALILE